MGSNAGKSTRASSMLAQLALVSGASAVLVTIVFIVLLTNQAQTVSGEKGRLSGILAADVGTTLTIVRTLQGLLSTMITISLSRSFSYLQWAFACDTQGGSYTGQLALSTTTSVLGTIRLVTRASSKSGPRFWGLSRWVANCNNHSKFIAMLNLDVLPN